jgi:hypothetical protein
MFFLFFSFSFVVDMTRSSRYYDNLLFNQSLGKEKGQTRSSGGTASVCIRGAPIYREGEEALGCTQVVERKKRTHIIGKVRQTKPTIPISPWRSAQIYPAGKNTVGHNEGLHVPF